MLWKSVITDATDEVSVSVWNKACYVVFGESASNMQALWAKGEEDVTQRAGLLTQWNKRLQLKFRCVCTAKIWKNRCEISVNEVEVEDSDVTV